MLCVRCGTEEGEMRDVPQAGGVTLSANLCAGCAAETTYVASAPPVEAEEVPEDPDEG